MFYNNTDFQLIKEQQQDRLREAEKHRLIQDLSPRSTVNKAQWQNVAYQLGNQMVTWGLQLKDQKQRRHPLSR